MYVSDLDDRHRAHLDASGIAEEVAGARGYRTINKKSELKRLGFGEKQARVPALLIPLRDVHGEPAGFQIRPDMPRMNENSKAIKYEMPGGATMVIDVPPTIRHQIRDPQVPLFITEGVKKADAAASLGLCCVALLGVWNWRGTNDLGGRTALPDWECVALNGRRVYVVFDSDVMLKREVHTALARLKSFLESRGAEVVLIYLPAGAGGAKMGLDDYLARGNGVDQLLGLAQSDLRSLPDDLDEPDQPYIENADGLTWNKPTASGPVPTPLTNFTARIVEDVQKDDGVGAARVYVLESKVKSRTVHFTIPAKEFGSLTWTTEHLGADAAICPGHGLREHARYAIQKLSAPVPCRTIYAHTGWRHIDGHYIYLHTGGGIAPSGSVRTVEVELPRGLDPYRLPDPADEEAACDAIRRSLAARLIAPGEQTWPILGAAYTAVLGEIMALDFTLWVHGGSGERKSTYTLLILGHFGEFRELRDLPANFLSTGNALEMLMFATKDALLVIDDFVPPPDSKAGAQQDAIANRLIRGVGNTQGRNRMTADGRLVGEKPPRCLPLVTAELPPPGTQSSNARTLEVEWGKRSVDLTRLTQAQREDAPHYAVAMAGFVKWLGPRIDALRGTMADRVRRTAALFPASHGRVQFTAGKMSIGIEMFLEYAESMGAIAVGEKATLLEEARAALAACAERTGKHQADRRPTALFLEYVRSFITQGSGYLADRRTGAAPAIDPQRWGYICRTTDGVSDAVPKPGAQKIGWVDPVEGLVHLHPTSAHRAIVQYAQGANVRFPAGKDALAKHLDQEGLLARKSPGRHEYRTRVEDKPEWVWTLQIETLFPEDENDGNDENGGSADDAPGPSLGPAAAGETQKADSDAVGADDRGPAVPAVLATREPTGLPGPTLVTRADQLPSVGDALARVETIGLDIETTGLNPRSDRIRLLSLATAEACYVIDCDTVDPGCLFGVLREKRLVGHHLAFDLGFLARMGFETGEVVDTMLLSQILHAGSDESRAKGYHSLAGVVERELGVTLPKGLQTSDWSVALSPEQIDYAARDARVVLELARHLEARVRQEGLRETAEVELRCLPAMVWMNAAGVPFDTRAWEALTAEAEAEAAQLWAELDDAAPPAPAEKLGQGWNWDSPAIVKRVFHEAGHELANTDDQTLATCVHPLADLVRRYRAVKKRLTSYGSNWLGFVEAGRVHPGWRQIGAASGRMACRNPNVQQMPRDGRYGRCIVAPAGRVLLKADYSQIELRVAAKLSGEERMLSAYRDGADLHRLTAQQLTGREDVSREDRQLAKAVNFGLLYGMGAAGFRDYARTQYGVSLSMTEAERYRTAFFDAYPALGDWHRQVKRRRERETRSLSGRRRLLRADTPDTHRLNTPVQGTGADGLKRALTLLWERRHECPGAVPVLACHDEIVVECDEGQEAAAEAWLRQAMVDGMALLTDPVPVEVEVNVGRTWAG